MTTSTGVFVFNNGASPAATGLMGALNPLVAGVAMKLAAASKTAEIDSRATERAIWSAQAWVELVCCFFIELLGLNQFSCRFPLIMLLQDFRPEVLRNLPKIGKDPSGGWTLVRENNIFAVVCLSGKSPDFSGREFPISIREFARRKVYLASRSAFILPTRSHLNPALGVPVGVFGVR